MALAPLPPPPPPNSAEPESALNNLEKWALQRSIIDIIVKGEYIGKLFFWLGGVEDKR